MPLGLLSDGNCEPGAIVCNPVPGIANAMTTGPATRFASWIGARSVHVPVAALRQMPLAAESAPSPMPLTVNVVIAAACTAARETCAGASRARPVAIRGATRDWDRPAPAGRALAGQASATATRP